MCMTKTPKVQAPPPSASEDRKPVYMHNRWLDGLGNSADRNGRNSLRIDPNSTVAPGAGAIPISATPLSISGSAPSPTSPAAKSKFSGVNVPTMPANVASALGMKASQ